MIMAYSRIRVERTPSTEKLIQPVSGNTYETAKFRKKYGGLGAYSICSCLFVGHTRF